MGERRFTSLLSKLEVDVKSMAFIDRLNRLEELSLIPNKQVWLIYGKLRNDISHEYPDQMDKNTETINNIYHIIPDLFVILKSIHSYIDKIIISTVDSGLQFPQNPKV